MSKNSTKSSKGSEVLKTENKNKAKQNSKGKDTVEKKLLYDKKNFATLCNALLFDGEPVIEEKNVEYTNANSSVHHSNKDTYQDRDIIADIRGFKDKDTKELDSKSLSLVPQIAQISLDNLTTATDDNKESNTICPKLGVVLYTVGIENQSWIDNRMILRTISYDGAEYKKQYIANETPHWVITIVLNYSNTKWNGPKSLSELIDDNVKLPTVLKKYCNDYKLFVEDVCFFDDELLNKMVGDIRVSLGLYKMLKTGSDSKAISDYIKNNPMENAYNVAEFVSVVADDTDMKETILKLEKNKGSDNMQDFYKVYADQKVKEATAKKDEVIKEKDKQLEANDKEIKELKEKNKQLEANGKEIKELKEKEKQIEKIVISALEDGSFTDDKIKKLFSLTDERLAEIKAKITE